jgi:hypothetical protein
MGKLWCGPECCPDPCDLYPIRSDVLGRERVKLENTEFEERLWDADFLSLLYLADFAATPWKSIDISPDNKPPAPGSKEEDDELEELLTMRDNERDGLMSEIIKQDACYHEYFIRLLGMTERTHPKTYVVLKIAARVGEMAAAEFKYRSKRLRPSQIIPALLPPVPFDHPSYPSGHALLAHLMARCAQAVRPEMAQVLGTLADDISRNREVAGLHYPTDTKAGKELAGKLFNHIERIPNIAGAIAAARTEWQHSPPTRQDKAP